MDPISMITTSLEGLVIQVSMLCADVENQAQDLWFESCGLHGFPPIKNFCFL